jgi:hypothetical protein
MTCWKATKPCGCLTFLYDDQYDSQRERERTLKEQIMRGNTVEKLTTPREIDEARMAWRSCPHNEPVKAKAALQQARDLLAQEAS